MLVSNGRAPALLSPGAAVSSVVISLPFLSCFAGNLVDEADRVGGSQSLAAELVGDLEVVLDVRALVQVDGAGEVLYVDHVGQVPLLEAQDRERPACTGVAAAGERDDLQPVPLRVPPGQGLESPHSGRRYSSVLRCQWAVTGSGCSRARAACASCRTPFLHYRQQGNLYSIPRRPALNFPISEAPAQVTRLELSSRTCRSSLR